LLQVLEESSDLGGIGTEFDFLAEYGLLGELQSVAGDARRSLLIAGCTTKAEQMADE
jgi:hypothetical protein